MRRLKFVRNPMYITSFPVNITNNHRVVKYSPEGVQVASWETPGLPSDIAVAPNGDGYVTINNNYRVVKYTRNGVHIGGWDVE